MSFFSLVDILRDRAEKQPERLAYTFLVDGETGDGQVFTYAELDQRARAIGSYLQHQYARGSRVLLLYPPGLEYVAAFFGCLYAGLIAVPAYPPRPRRAMPRIQTIVADCQPAVALTTSRILSNIQERLSGMPDMAALDWLDSGILDPDLADHWKHPQTSGEDLAYLQYTSGSTSDPKGVMVSHANLDYTISDLIQGWEKREESVMVTWLPPFHDLGLIYGILQPIYGGFPCIMMAPVSFIQRPFRWLEAISHYRGTHSAAPNFAFELCLSKVKPEQRATLDLSSWLIALNGAEPIRRDTMERFAETYASTGFKWSAFTPAYGLAEATLQVTGVLADSSVVDVTLETATLEKHCVVEASRGQKDTRVLVGYDASIMETRWRIVDPEALTECGPDQVGEIWIAGPGVARGYWNRPEATIETFSAHLADTGEGPFLRTGDLGFVKDGHLFVTGRIKDLIIVRGRNHYPQDIELTAEQSHSALRLGCGAAFAVEVNGEERAAIVYELRREQRRADIQEVTDAIVQAVAFEHELQLHAVALMLPGQVPKTSSGKIQRHACRRKFLAGEFELLGQWAQPVEEGISSSPDIGNNSEVRFAIDGNGTYDEVQDWLIARVAERVQVSPQRIDVQRPLDRYGLDSLGAVAITGELAAWLGRDLSPTLFYDYPTVQSITRHLACDAPGSVVDADETDGNSMAAGQGAYTEIATGVSFPPAVSVGAPAIGREPPQKRWTSLMPLREKGSRIPLFVVPPGASTVLSFGQLVNHLDGDQPVYGFQPLGMDGQYPPHFRVEEMAAHYIREMMTVQSTGPYLLAGRCFGGLVAFEMAQQLQAQGEEVAMLAILDTLQPPKPAWLRNGSSGDLEVGSGRFHRLFRRWGQRLYLFLKRVTITEAFSLYLVRSQDPELKSPTALGRDGWNIRNTTRAHYEANELYLPSLYDGRLTLFSNSGHTGSHQLNWAALTGKAVDIHIVPGNHFTMFDEPHVQVLAEALTCSIKDALSSGASQDDGATFLSTLDEGGSSPSPAVDAATIHVTGVERICEVPRNELERQICEATETVFGLHSRSVNDSILDLQPKPFAVAYLLAELGRRTGKPISMASLVQAPTPAQLADSARENHTSECCRSLVGIQPDGPRPPFFLVPDIDRTVVSLLELGRLIGRQQPCYGLQPLGLERGQRPHTTVEEMAAFYVQEMRRIHPSGPYSLGGIGFGGVVAFEMAQQLSESRDDVAFLAVLDTMIPPNATFQLWYPPTSPGMQETAPGWFVQRLIGRLVYRWQIRQYRHRIPRRALSKMAWQQRINYRFSPTTRRIQTMLTAHFVARLRYQPKVYPGPIALFSNSLHPGAHQIKWAMLTDVGMEIEVIPGNHSTIFQQPNVSELARRLEMHLVGIAPVACE
ncbi:MAG: AMP-binding protein [Chloroflexota bacterium]|nr:AMP-binding protein [Chloroflexota bacterium]